MADAELITCREISDQDMSAQDFLEKARQTWAERLHTLVVDADDSEPETLRMRIQADEVAQASASTIVERYEAEWAQDIRTHEEKLPAQLRTADFICNNYKNGRPEDDRLIEGIRDRAYNRLCRARDAERILGAVVACFREMAGRQASATGEGGRTT